MVIRTAADQNTAKALPAARAAPAGLPAPRYGETSDAPHADRCRHCPEGEQGGGGQVDRGHRVRADAAGHEPGVSER